MALRPNLFVTVYTNTLYIHKVIDLFVLKQMMEMQQLCKLILLQIAHMFPIIKLPRIAACKASI